MIKPLDLCFCTLHEFKIFNCPRASHKFKFNEFPTHWISVVPWLNLWTIPDSLTITPQVLKRMPQRWVVVSADDVMNIHWSNTWDIGICLEEHINLRLRWTRNCGCRRAWSASRLRRSDSFYTASRSRRRIRRGNTSIGIFSARSSASTLNWCRQRWDMHKPMVWRNCCRWRLFRSGMLESDDGKSDETKF